MSQCSAINTARLNQYVRMLSRDDFLQYEYALWHDPLIRIPELKEHKMKEFKKWYKVNGPSLYPGGAEPAWKAALEMIKDIAINADGPEHNAYYEVLDALDKELGTK